VNQRLQELICDNLALLDQALDLLDGITEADYDRSPAGFEPHRIGGHLRHCLELYECFLGGLSTGLADYDSRRRDARVEHERGAAALRVIETIDQLSTTAFERERGLLVRVEGAQDSDPVDSSVARELGFLLSHTIHHFALIAMTMRALGLPVEPAFGVSPSTLRYRAEAAACAR
jgi:uncharacterized damage-inducible protein DinB